MEQRILVIAFLVINLLIISLSSFAQKGSKALQITGKLIIPSAQKSVGFGLSLKGSYGINEYGEITLSAGVSKFKMKDLDGAGETKVRFIPFLVGYRQKIQKFYIEPKAGIGELGGRILSVSGSDYSRPSVTAAFGGLEAGFSLKRFNVGFDFLAAHGISNSSAGIWHNKNLHYISASLGYTLF
ncbi:MAG TPA: hypothetical protein VJ552_04870 [Sediminibacterium sp.]|nr:hypothetical protein [Sediminibacterium sp.]